MNRIKKLPKEISRKIAAGEVIERPSSVVKELVENSLDAGAAAIRVELLMGGKGLVRVSDNGQGMSRKDALLCFESHATSKISREGDLDCIATLGFRGEALASIAAVSRVILKTAEADSTQGTLIEREGLEVLKETDIAFPTGTSLEVKDLFFNLPARKKFLRSERAELNRIVKYMTQAALAHPGIRFALTHGARKVFDYPPVSQLKERIFQIYGKNLLESLLEINCQDGERSLYGFASKPPAARGDKKLQIFFVNGRPVRDNTLQAALNQAHKPFLEKNQFAAAFLFLGLPFSEIDVNVHPAKTEVRFRDTRAVFSFVYKSIEQAVLREMGVKEVYPSSRQEVQPPPVIAERHQPSLGKEPTEFRGYTHELFKFPGKEKQAGPRVLGQYLNFYIVAADKEGVLIIDQHNAHERVLFEQYVALDREQEWPRKLALHPPLLELSPDQIVSLEENRVLLEEAGFQVDAMGGASYALKEYPDVFSEKEAQDIFLALLEDVGQEKIDKKKHKLLATMACKTAIKAGEELALAKMSYLVEELFKTSNPAICPHGRPIIVRITQKDIEKGLGRHK